MWSNNAKDNSEMDNWTPAGQSNPRGCSGRHSGGEGDDAVTPTQMDGQTDTGCQQLRVECFL